MTMEKQLVTSLKVHQNKFFPLDRQLKQLCLVSFLPSPLIKLTRDFIYGGILV